MRDSDRATYLQAELAKAQWDRLPLWNGADLRKALVSLEIKPVDLAYLLHVAPRTVQRWLDAPDVLLPGPVDRVIRAWLQLNHPSIGAEWKPIRS